MSAKVPGKLIRAARELLDWNQSKLAEMADCSLATVMRIELGESSHFEETRERIITVMEASGVKFIPSTTEDGAGVKWASPEDQARLQLLNARRGQRATKTKEPVGKATPASDS